jgi:Tol biopolymer transport system component
VLQHLTASIASVGCGATEGPWRDTSPRWAAEGPADARLAWISDRSGKPQIWVLRAGGAVQITNLADPPQTLAWSPDGKSLAYTARGKLFMVAAAGGKPRAYQFGDLEISGEPAWMPDGQSILLRSRRRMRHTRSKAARSRAVAADGSRRQITHHPGPDEEPCPRLTAAARLIGHEPKARATSFQALCG